jgi:hypothetical protein
MTEIALIQLGTASVLSGTSLTLTLTKAAPAGSTLVAFLGESQTSAINTVSDTAGSFWSAGKSINQTSAINLVIWTGLAGAAVPIGGRITATWSGSAGVKTLAVYALTGVVALDQSPNGVGVAGNTLTASTGTLAQAGNEIALFALLENGGEADGDYTESPGFTSLDAVYQNLALYVAMASPPTSAPVAYSPIVGTSNKLAAIGIVYRGSAPNPPIRRMTARIRGVPPSRPARVSIRGAQLYDPAGHRFFPRGANWDQSVLASLDAPYLAGMGGKVARMTLGFWIDNSNPSCSVPLPNSPHDAVNPNSPATGFLDPTILAFFQDEIAQCLAAGVWPIIAMHGADCNFGTYVWPADGSPAAGQTLVSMFRQAWQYLVSLYKGVDNIFCYEIIAEPHPTNNPRDNSNTPASGNTPTDTGPGAAWIYNQVIQDIRAQDVWTPIAIGPAKTYNPRNLSQLMPNILPANRAKLLAFLNFFELGAGGYTSPQRNGGYIKQVNGWPDFPNGTNYTGYPGLYFDAAGAHAGASGNYAGKGTQVWMDKDWLRGLMNVGVADSVTYDIPLVVDQFGGSSGNLGYDQYLKDLCALMIEFQVGGVYWVQRASSQNGAPYGNASGFIWLDSNGVYHDKTGTDPAALLMDEYGAFPGPQSTTDVVGILSDFFQNRITP